jgi:hypothetical protein
LLRWRQAGKKRVSFLGQRTEDTAERSVRLDGQHVVFPPFPQLEQHIFHQRQQARFMTNILQNVVDQAIFQRQSHAMGGFFACPA